MHDDALDRQCPPRGDEGLPQPGRVRVLLGPHLKHRSTFRDHQLLLDGTDLPPLIHALEDIRTL